MLNSIKKSVDEEIHLHAKNNIIKKLQNQGINYKELADADFNSLVEDEIEILKTDTKKVGAGIGIGLLISAITGI